MNNKREKFNELKSYPRPYMYSRELILKVCISVFSFPIIFPNFYKITAPGSFLYANIRSIMAIYKCEILSTGMLFPSLELVYKNLLP